MVLDSSLAGKALLFTAVAYLIPVALGWWLYLSRVAKPAVAEARAPGGAALWLSLLLVYSAVQMTLGGIWDAAMHIKTGVVPGGKDFLWPPHIMLYASFLIAFLVALGTFGALGVMGWRMGVRDPRHWVRQNPYIGAVGLASLYTILSVPGDAIWHELFGLDLTGWSPPHLMIDGTGYVLMICTVGLLMKARSAAARPGAVNAIGIITSAVALNWASLAAVTEWEFPGSPAKLAHVGRALWLYPVVFGGLALFNAVVGRRLVPRWGITVLTAAYYLVRGLLSVVFPALGFPFMAFSPVVLLGAVLLDALPWDRIRSGYVRYAGMAGVYTAGYLLVAMPILALRKDLPIFSGYDIGMIVVTTFVASFVLLPLAEWAGSWLIPSVDTHLLAPGHD